jgi:hypothetical protein
MMQRTLFYLGVFVILLAVAVGAYQDGVNGGEERASSSSLLHRNAGREKRCKSGLNMSLLHDTII